MHTETVEPWQHAHSFNQDKPRAAERRTLVVISMTAAMMVVEIVAGIAYGSMALLADGLHMGSHTAALGLTALAYVLARRHAKSTWFSFGTGKVNALAGFTGAVLLALFALLMAWQSVDRLFNPVAIVFNQAIAVAVAGLVVNGLSVFVLGAHDHHGHHRGDDHHVHKHEDHNLRAAYFHVLADAVTSLTAIFALLAGKYLGLNWMDPVMGIAGSILVAKWSWGLLRDTGRVLLDAQQPVGELDAIREAIESECGNRVSDLHVWSIGPGIRAAILGVVTDEAQPPGHYKELIPAGLGVVHTTVEVHSCVMNPDIASGVRRIAG